MPTFGVSGGGGGGAPAASFIPSPKVPAGLTLRNTYTASASGLTFPVEWIYVVAVGGGGAGNSYLGAGGGGACIQGWMRAADLTEVTIGAGGGPDADTGYGNGGGVTLAGPIRAAGGGGASQSMSPATPGRGWRVEPGAGQGALSNTGSYTATYNPYNARAYETPAPAYGMFFGGRAEYFEARAVITGATSGAGGLSAAGGDGMYGPGGGSGIWSVAGGSSTAPDGTVRAGGAGYNSGRAGGGAGILAAGGAATSTNGGAGGSGGGGGGAASGGTGGAGGGGAVLVYY